MSFSKSLVTINVAETKGFLFWGALHTAFLVGAILITSLASYSQEAIPVSDVEWPSGRQAAASTVGTKSSSTREKTFRVERTPVAGGSELITIFAKVRGLNASGTEEASGDLPLISLLRDTLGDGKPENDRLRYLWLLTSGNLSFGQKAAAAVPFLYTRVGNNKEAGSSPPKPLADIDPVDQKVWDKVFFTVFKRLVIEDMVMSIKMPFYQYRKNSKDYRNSSIAQALTLLTVYQEMEGDNVLSPAEMTDLRSRLLLSGKTLSPFIKRENFSRLDQTSDQKNKGRRGVNWEILRQRCESEGLYFEPLQMLDGGASHALVWVDEEDVKTNRGASFNSRFLNIKSPWADPRLLDWRGYSEVRWYDEENRVVPEGTPNARKRRMIPLALYGLDFPKIPVLLVDFRSNWNAKSREMSRRIIDDLVKNVLSVSVFKNPAILVGRFLADFLVRRHGIDINQGSRITSYARLKLLIMLNESIDPEFKSEISGRVDAAALNPLQNSAGAEVKLAKQQYRNLMAYAEDPKGLPARIAKDRSREMVSLKHNNAEMLFFALGRIFSFGFYEHREKWTPEMAARLSTKRQLEFHERNLQMVAKTSIDPRIDADEESLKRSLEFVGESDITADKKTMGAIAEIFTKTNDRNIRELSLLALYRTKTPSSLRQILALYNDSSLTEDWREVCARYLKLAAYDKDNVPSSLAREIVSALDD